MASPGESVSASGDILQLHTLVFPVLDGNLSWHPAHGDWSWYIEINCGESPQLDFQNWSDDREEQELDWLSSAQPRLYAQLLPLRVTSPDELIGRRYTFPQTDDPAELDAVDQWPYFTLYLLEHIQVFPVTVAFTGKRDQQYRVEISGRWPAGRAAVDHEFHVSAWVDWKG